VGSNPNRIKPKTIKLVFNCFSAKHVALRRKSKDWMARNQNVSQWSDMSTRGLLFQWDSTIKIQLSHQTRVCSPLHRRCLPAAMTIRDSHISCQLKIGGCKWKLVFYYTFIYNDRRCNGEHTRVWCCSSWVRTPIGSNQRLLNWYLIASPLST
jgi:hypothetical protein